MTNPNDIEVQSEKSIGSIIKETFGLSVQQVDRILENQRQKSLRFGESAVDLGIISQQDVVWALSRQFEYQYSQLNIDAVPKELVTALDPFSEESENFRAIRSNLVLGKIGASAHSRAIAVISPDHADGRTYFAINLAISLSQLGAKTVIVDADLRTARTSALFSSSQQVGLSIALSRRTEATVTKPLPEIDNLYLLAAGPRPPNPLELVQRQDFAKLISLLTSKFEYVIVDTPPLSSGSDARAIALQCGASIAICRKNSTKLADIERLINQVSKETHKFLGIVSNDFQK